MSTMMRGGLIAGKKVSPLQLLILLQLYEGPKYGYEMLKVLREEFEGVWEIKTGTFYPAIRSLENRGFVETSINDEVEFYSLTEKGISLLNRLGERFELEYKFGDRYFKTILKLMPKTLKEKILRTVQNLSNNNIDVAPYLQLLLEDIKDRNRKLEVLGNLKNKLRFRLDKVEDIYKKIEGELI